MRLIPSKKRGFGLKGGFWNRFGVVFIQASMDTVSDVLSNYFETKCNRNFSLEAIAEIEQKQSRLSHEYFFFQYLGHDWTVWWASNREDIAFTLSYLLETKSFVLTYSGTSDWTEVKIFDGDRFVEHYKFGFYDLEPDQKIAKDATGYETCFIETVQNIYYPGSPLPAPYRHMFCSSIRDLSEAEVNNILASSTDEFGLLNNICEYYNLYFPDCSEIPLPSYHSEKEFLSLNIEDLRIDCIKLPESAFYWDNILPVPRKITN